MGDSIDLMKIMKLFNNLDGTGVMYYVAPLYEYKTCRDRKHTYWVWRGKCDRGTRQFINTNEDIRYITCVKVDYVTLVKDDLGYKLDVIGSFEYLVNAGTAGKHNFNFKQESNGTAILDNYNLIFLMKLFLQFIDMTQEIKLPDVTKKLTSFGYSILGFEYFQGLRKSYNTYVQSDNIRNMIVLVPENCWACIGDFTINRSFGAIYNSMYFPITMNGIELVAQYGIYINKKSKMQRILW